MFPPIPNPTVEPVPPKFGEADLIRRSASRIEPPAERQTEVAKLIDVSKCIGCKACQAACLEWNQLTEEVGGFTGRMENPADLTENSWTLMRYTEYDNPETGNLEWLIRKDGCMHCEDPGCLKACPAPGAIVQYSNGIVDFVHENCIGCGYCVKGCPFNIPRLSQVDRKAYKCSLCVDRVAVGQGPACAKACPTQAIVFGTKDEMTEWAGARIEDLKSRGFANAGLYDPPGVGGTHVMYVLHHADRPQLYANLPQNPRISTVVELWKGVTKYAGLAAVGFAAAFAVVHATIARRNEVSRAEEYFFGYARTGFQGRIRMGFDERGRVTAADVYVVQENGATAGFPDWPSAGETVSILYQPETMRFRGMCVMTNTVPRSAQRGPGHNQTVAAVEPLIDKAAQALGIDRLAIRRLNGPRMDAKVGENQGPVTSCYLQEAFDKAAALFNYEERKLRSGQKNGSKVTGIGIGQAFHPAGFAGFDGLVRITPDGKLHLHSGVGNLGTFSHTGTSRIAAEVLKAKWRDNIQATARLETNTNSVND